MLLYSSPGSVLTARWVGSDHWLSIWDYSFPSSREDETASLPRCFFFSQILSSPSCCTILEDTRGPPPVFIQSLNLQSRRLFLAYLMCYHELCVFVDFKALRRTETSITKLLLFLRNCGIWWSIFLLIVSVPFSLPFVITINSGFAYRRG